MNSFILNDTKVSYFDAIRFLNNTLLHIAARHLQKFKKWFVSYFEKIDFVCFMLLVQWK